MNYIYFVSYTAETISGDFLVGNAEMILRAIIYDYMIICDIEADLKAKTAYKNVRVTNFILLNTVAK